MNIGTLYVVCELSSWVATTYIFFKKLFVINTSFFLVFREVPEKKTKIFNDGYSYNIAHVSVVAI